MNSIQTHPFVRQTDDCEVISTGQGEHIHELIGQDSPIDGHSVAYVEVDEGGSSIAHYHPEVEESYIFTGGTGRLIVDGLEKTVTAGQVANIPVGTVHQIFNDHKKALQFYCVCAAPWSPNCQIEADQPKTPGSTSFPIVSHEDRKGLETDTGEILVELLGAAGPTEKHGVAFAMVERNAHTVAHYHPDIEESFIFLSGQGTLKVDGNERTVKTGDVATVPKNIVHQILNEQSEALCYYNISTPPQIPDCSVIVFE